MGSKHNTSTTHLRTHAWRAAASTLARTSIVEQLEVRLLLAIDSLHAPVDPLSVIYEPAFEYAPFDGAQPAASSAPVGFTPSQLRHAYGYDKIFFSGGIVGDGTGQTIAIIDAYHNPNIASDLHSFDVAFGLPDPPSFTQVAQDGSTNYPGTDPTGGWEVEIALDVEWIHALAPQANIILVETVNNGTLYSGVDYARNLPGVSVISMSWGAPEFSGETTLDAHFVTPAGHTGITFLASTGDSGKPGIYPAYSPNVVAVGGTTLSIDGSSNYVSESGWSGSGGGISTLEAQPSYQAGAVTQSATQRTIPDIALDANPSSGVAVYDTFNNAPSTPWSKIGGTSLSAPAWAALIGIANQGRAQAGQSTLEGRTQTLPMIYSMPTSVLHDVTTGNNGFAAAAGYDLVTGRGTPRAELVALGFVQESVAGRVFSDVNKNGTLDAGESGLSGWTVYDDANSNGTFDAPIQSVASSTDVPEAIPDRSTINSTTTVSGLGSIITDINVNVTIHHTFDGDLILTLIAPDNTSITLANRNGGSGDNFLGTTFDDQAATAIGSGSAPYSGSYRPTSVLSALNGKNPNGTWTLRVSDNANGNSGTLDNWSLQITSGDEASTVSGVDGSYQFTTLAVGTHHIREVPQTNYLQTSPPGGTYDVNVSANNAILNQNFGNAPSILSGEIFNDQNNNGVLDAGEPGLANWTVYDDLNNSGTLNAGEPSVVTPVGGAFQFSNVANGTHYIREVKQGGLTQTSPPGGVYVLNVSAGDMISGLNFGNFSGTSFTPLPPDLLDASDTGTSSSDDLTRLNNSDAGSVLQFSVGGTIVGATINIYSDGNLIGSAVSGGSTTIVTTDGATMLSDGDHTITAVQVQPGKLPSPNSLPLVIHMDATPAVATINPVSPNPRNTPVDQMTITFTKPVTGFELADLALSHDGGGDLLEAGQTLTTSDQVTWTLAGLDTITTLPGSYSLDLTLLGSLITDAAGNVVQMTTSTSFTVLSSVVGRAIFYNQSKFDGNTVDVSTSDDNAIASDKVAYLAGSGPADFASVTSYRNGINGIMVDLAGSHPNVGPDDFTFKIGNDNSPETWNAAPAPINVSVRAGAGTSGSDRVEIIWDNGAIINTWLEVTVAATPNTGLGAPDIFYFGNRVGDTGLGDTATLLITNALDEASARSNQGVGQPIDSAFDFNRDGIVSAVDQITARMNVGFLARLDLPNPSPSLVGGTAVIDANAASAAALFGSVGGKLEEPSTAARLLPGDVNDLIESASNQNSSFHRAKLSVGDARLEIPDRRIIDRLMRNDDARDQFSFDRWLD